MYLTHVEKCIKLATISYNKDADFYVIKKAKYVHIYDKITNNKREIFSKKIILFCYIRDS